MPLVHPITLCYPCGWITLIVVKQVAIICNLHSICRWNDRHFALINRCYSSGLTWTKKEEWQPGLGTGVGASRSGGSIQLKEVEREASPVSMIVRKNGLRPTQRHSNHGLYRSWSNGRCWSRRRICGRRLGGTRDCPTFTCSQEKGNNNGQQKSFPKRVCVSRKQWDTGLHEKCSFYEWSSRKTRVFPGK